VAGGVDGSGFDSESGDTFSKAETRFSTSLSRSSTPRDCPNADKHRTRNAQKIEKCVFIGGGERGPTTTRLAMRVKNSRLF
jgi:hypothetical protein